MKTSTLIRRFLPYFKKYRGMLFLDLVCAALTTVCDLVLPLIVRDVTDLAANNLSALTVSFVLRVGGIYVLLRIVDALANFYMASRGHIMGTFIERDTTSLPICKRWALPITATPRWARSWPASPATCLR